MKEKIICYRHNYGLPLSKWERLVNHLWYYVAEEDKLWAKIIYYPLDWLEQRKFDFICLIGKHFPDDEECVRCYKKLTSTKK